MSKPTPTSCKTCGQPIIWVYTKNGKRVALDAQPIPLPTHSHFILDGQGVAHNANGAAYRVHFEHCNSATEFD